MPPHASPGPVQAQGDQQAAWYSAQELLPVLPPGFSASRASSPSPAWAMHYPRKIEDLMEVISTLGGATPPKLKKEGSAVLVGSSAHPEIRMCLRGSLELRRGSWHPLWEDSMHLQSRRPLCNLLSPPLHGTPSAFRVFLGRPQPGPALLKELSACWGSGCSCPSPPARLPASWPALEPALCCPLFLSPPPMVGGGVSPPQVRSTGQPLPSPPWASKAQRE